MINWPQISEALRKERMILPDGRLDMVLDTDTYNEVDDQFALCYGLLSPERLNVEAVYAAPFHNKRSRDAKDGMEQSYAEIQRLLGAMGRDIPVLRGADRFMQGAEDCVDSPAARDLVRRAMQRPEGKPLYVAAIGAITNIAAALRLEPRITEKIVVIWLGGHALYWPDTREFNLRQDVHASRTVFDCGAPMILVPCMGVASHLITTVYELKGCIGGRNAMCDILVQLVEAYGDGKPGWGKPLWDVAVIGLMVQPDFATYAFAPSPLITDDCLWQGEDGRHAIRVVQTLNRSAIFEDMFAKLGTS